MKDEARAEIMKMAGDPEKCMEIRKSDICEEIACAFAHGYNHHDLSLETLERILKLIMEDGYGFT